MPPSPTTYRGTEVDGKIVVGVWFQNLTHVASRGVL